MDEYLDRANEYQKKLSQNDVEKHIDWLSFNDFSFEHFDIRFGIINQMELCDRYGRISRMICSQFSQRRTMKNA